jgi:type I restriction enzyme M protein
LLDSNLKSKINLLWDKFWSSGISNPLDAIVQMSYLLFMKRLSDADNKNKNDALISGEEYISILLIALIVIGLSGEINLLMIC